MNYEVLYKGSFPMIKVNLIKGESIKAESGAMVAMSSTVDVEGKLEGGLLKGIGRKLSGEKFFFQTLKANRGNGEAYFAASSPGGVLVLDLDGMNEYILQKDGFLASTEDVTIDSKVQNLAKGLFSGEGFFVLRVSGKGTLFVSSFGEIHEIDIPAGEEYIVDNEHLVAWPSTVPYTIEKASSGWISSFTSGEGLVCKFTGPAKIYIQTRNPSSFGHWMKSIIGQ
ncbi:TIGR00266 family protein [Abyssisolibacter fermentans]|uniref:TIGR00266 family protein n=1 Tax=Abyssisolibacter fermentans TaxID=1766203 RepID=UPI000835CBBF|nr:TIGR00266 family protein [Abyssisolibacter fermentans]